MTKPVGLPNARADNLQEVLQRVVEVLNGLQGTRQFGERAIRVQDLLDTGVLTTLPRGELVYAAPNSDIYVLKTGDTMTGALGFQNGPNVAFISLGAGGDLNISPGDDDHIVYINAGSASGAGTGQLITGRFRSAMPIEVRNTSVTVASGPAGVGSALVRCNAAAAVTLTIRENDGTAGQDWNIGNYFSVMQEGAGQVSLAPASANVVLHYPAALSLKTREQYSAITATLYDITGGVETWVISGDAEPA